MSYETRLIYAKAFVSLAWLVAGLRAFIALPAPHSERVLNTPELMIASMSSYIFILMLMLALPTIYLIWSKLHGTGRSLRMASFSLIGVVLASTLAMNFTNEVLEIEGVDPFPTHLNPFRLTFVPGLAIFAPLALGLILSIKPRT